MVPRLLDIVLGALLLVVMYCCMVSASSMYSSESSVPVVTVSVVVEGTVAVMVVISDVSPFLICVVAVVSTYKNCAWFS
jgi:hypothetical protein